MNRILTVNILLAVLCSTLLAKLAADGISYKLSHTFPTTPRKSAAPRPAAAVQDLTSFSPILEKGLFGKGTQGKLTPIGQVGDAKSRGGGTSQGDLLLLGTAVGSSRESFALVQKQSTKEEQVYRLGDNVFDCGRLVAVKREMIELLAGSNRIKIYTPMVGADTAKPAPAGKPGVLASQVGAGTFVVDQRVLNAALDNIGQAMTDARLLPSLKDGKVEGFKVSEVKPAGVFGMVGVKNGDVLLRMNDFPIDSPEKAIQSFVSLKGQSKIRLDLIRDGQPTTFNYEIR